jgi:hypothetical protein
MIGLLGVRLSVKSMPGGWSSAPATPGTFRGSMTWGDRVVWDLASEAGQALSGHLAGLREAFRVKFGREPGPDDPVFFDPEADDPRRLGLEKALLSAPPEF